MVAGFVVYFIDHLVPSEGSHGVQSGAMVTLAVFSSTAIFGRDKFKLGVNAQSWKTSSSSQAS